MGEFAETGSRLEVGGGEKHGGGSYCLMGSAFLLGMMKSSGNEQW
jgi:hypothetical protein